MSYAELSVTMEDGRRTVIVKDELRSPKRILTDKAEVVTALMALGGGCYLTEDEKLIAKRMKEEQETMEASPEWGSF